MSSRLIYLFDSPRTNCYSSRLTAIVNKKGVLDVDTVKGCMIGLTAHPDGGCYGECYANKTAARYGIDFTVSVSRKIYPATFWKVFQTVQRHSASWYRIGTAGDPSHDWGNTLAVCEALRETGKIPVIITKHWKVLSEKDIQRLKVVRAVVNTSTSGLDSDAEITHRVKQINRLKVCGVRSVCRVVTCKYGETEWAKRCNEKQTYLLSLNPVIDNPLRTSRANARVLSGEIILTKHDGAIGGGKYLSLNNASTYLGACENCPDQCGVEDTTHNLKEEKCKQNTQIKLVFS